MNDSMEELKAARAAIEAARAIIGAARFRTAMHDHETVVRFAEPGEKPGARSSTLSLSAKDAGLCRAYQKKAPFVTASRHEWVVDNAPLVLAECRQGVCVLIGETIRVRQGRGTALVCERLIDGRWK